MTFKRFHALREGFFLTNSMPPVNSDFPKNCISFVTFVEVLIYFLFFYFDRRPIGQRQIKKNKKNTSSPRGGGTPRA